MTPPHMKKRNSEGAVHHCMGGWHSDFLNSFMVTGRGMNSCFEMKKYKLVSHKDLGPWEARFAASGVRYCIWKLEKK